MPQVCSCSSAAPRSKEMGAQVLSIRRTVRTWPLRSSCPQPGGLPPGRAFQLGEEVREEAGKELTAPLGSICGSQAITESELGNTSPSQGCGSLWISQLCFTCLVLCLFQLRHIQAPTGNPGADQAPLFGVWDFHSLLRSGQCIHHGKTCLYKGFQAASQKTLQNTNEKKKIRMVGKIYLKK